MDNVPPTTVPLQFALVRYGKALEYLERSKTSLSSERALEILVLSLPLWIINTKMPS